VRARRIVLAATAVIAVSFISFVTLGLSFDPTRPLVLNPDKRLRSFLLHHYHLSDPILVRYWLWVKGLFSHGFGTTVSLDVSGSPPHLRTPGQPIGPAIWHGAGITLQLVAFALVLTSRRWFQVGPPTGGFVDWFRHMALPVVALAIGLIGIYARYVRTAMIVSLGEQYTLVARAKGLPERRVVLRHALRNSLVPFMSLLSLEIGAVVSASLAADAVFGLGGPAEAFLHGLAAVASDLLVGLLDPRIRVV